MLKTANLSYKFDDKYIFNADGSFNPSELNNMYKKINENNLDVIFASRYEKNCSSTIVAAAESTLGTSRFIEFGSHEFIYYIVLSTIF